MGCRYQWYKGKYLINKVNFAFHFVGFSKSKHLTSTDPYIDFKIKFLRIFTFKNSRLLAKYFDIRKVQIKLDQALFHTIFTFFLRCATFSTNPVGCSHFPCRHNTPRSKNKMFISDNNSHVPQVHAIGGSGVGGGGGRTKNACPLLGPNSFIFIQLSETNWPNNGLAPHLLGERPRLENSRSATIYVLTYQAFLDYGNETAGKLCLEMWVHRQINLVLTYDLIHRLLCSVIKDSIRALKPHFTVFPVCFCCVTLAPPPSSLIDKMFSLSLDP